MDLHFKVNKSLGGTLDPEIVPLLNELNDEGLKTFSSQGWRNYSEGWVIFSRMLGPKELERALAIVDSHGLRPVPKTAWTGTGRKLHPYESVLNKTMIHFVRSGD